MEYLRHPSPLGPLLLAADPRGLRHVRMAPADPEPGWSEGESATLAEARRQLDAYFAGALKVFDLPRAPEGTPFQRRVWEALGGIPFGETWTYGALAARLGDPKLTRAVGAANGANPIAIVIPCHRVIGGQGQLVGYAGGLDRKAFLLRHEGRQPGLFGEPRGT